MGHPEDGAGEIVHDSGKFQLQLVLEVAVQGREGLVQEDHLGVRQEDPGQGAALLLATGDLPGPEVRHGFQPEAAEGVLHQGVPVRLATEDGQEVPPDGPIGEEGVLLEEVARPALLGREDDPGGAVKEDPAIQGDAALVRPEDTGDTAEGHTLAAAGGPQQGQGLRPGVKGDLQLEVPQLFPDVNMEHYRRPPFRWRSSSRLTVKRNTAEMATFTSTQRKAMASSPVCQSW